MTSKYFFKEDLSWVSEKGLFLFFDFDGTLVPIQNDPSLCWLDKETKSYLKRIVSKGFAPVAILSGRSLKDIKKRINIKGIYYSGNHGLEISGRGLKFIHPQAKSMIKSLKHIKDIISKAISHIPGVFIEDKYLSFTLHFRMADEKGKKKAKSIFYKTISRGFKNMPFKVLKGKQILELAPNIEWDKGKTVHYILKNAKQECTPLYIGDDLTDETAFLALRGQGITIRIGKSKHTHAEYYLVAQEEIQKFFQTIYDIIKK